jgi:hypothetical protein
MMGRNGTAQETMQSQIGRLSDKLDQFVRKEDYERRHGELVERISKLESGDDILRQEFSSKIDAIGVKIDTMIKDYYSLRNDISKASTSKWQWIAGVFCSFVVGSGGLYVLLAALHALR